MKRRILYISYYLLNILGGVDPVALVATLPLAALCFWQVGKIQSRHFQFADMFWFIMYLFFVIGPLQGIHEGYLAHGGPVDGYPITTRDVILASAIPLIFAMAIAASSVMFPPLTRRPRALTISPAAMPLLTVAMVSLFFMYVSTTGFANLFLPRQEKLAVVESSYISTFFYGAIIVTATLSASILPLTSRLPLGSKFAFFVQLAFVLTLLAVTSNPINSARYFFIAAWMPMGFILLGGRIGMMKIYTALGFSLIVLMPIMSLSSRLGWSAVTNLEDFSQYVFNVPYIDVFDLLVYEINYIDQNGIYWGSKSLGALLFFIPRSVWTGKATLIAQDMGDELLSMGIAGTANLSMFFGGEFFADGGLFGVVFGSAILCFLLFRFAFRRSFTINGLEVPSLVLMAALPILLRGPIGANLPLTVSELIVLFGMKWALARPKRSVVQPARRKAQASIGRKSGPGVPY
jgi:hypothetical protein